MESNGTRNKGITRARFMAPCMIVGSVGLALAAISGSVNATTGLIGAANANEPDAFADLPDHLILTATFRDFRAKDDPGGHPDFQSFPGPITTVGLVEDQLDADGLPVVKSLRGYTLTAPYQDKDGNNINPALYDPSLGDRAGSMTPGSSLNGFESSESFSQWYRNVPGVNLATQVDLVLERLPNSDRYVYDSANNPDAVERSFGGFFPINSSLYGNYNSNRNYHFTTHISTKFVYDESVDQIFKFTGDDDVWVFIDGRLAIDLGGLHGKQEQYLDLSRLDWVEDGEEITLDVFHAERRFSGSNFRIETTLRLKDASLPVMSNLHD